MALPKTARSQRAKVPPRPTIRLGLEILEDRTLPSGFAVLSTAPAVNAVVNNVPLDYTVNFSAPIDATTVDAADFQVTDNSGTPRAADSFSVNGQTQVNFHYSTGPFSSLGQHTMSMAVGAMLDATATPLDAFSGSFTFAAGPATHFVVSAPSNVTAGGAFSFTVAALDANNNTDAGYAGTVHFTSSDGQAQVPVNATLASGSGVFSVVLKTADNETLTAMDTAVTPISGTSFTISVSPGSTTHFGFTNNPSSVLAGNPVLFIITARDAYENRVTAYNATVLVTTTDQSRLPFNKTLAAGQVNVPLVLNMAGSQTVTATDQVTSTINGTSNAVTVITNVLNNFSLNGVPSTVSAGTPFSFSLTAADGFGNLVPNVPIRFSSTDSQALLPDNATLTSGQGNFTATLATAGSIKLTVTQDVVANPKSSTSTITISSAAATHFAITSSGNSATAGTAFNMTLTALDSFNNTANAYTGTVHFTSSDGGATLPANSVLTSGTGAFSVTLKTTGNQTVTATDTVNTNLNGTSNSIAVGASMATHFGITAPSGAASGAAFSITVTALNASNNPATGYTGTVHFTSSDGVAILPVNATLTSGVGTFSVTLKTAGNQTVTATDTTTSGIVGSAAISVASASIHLLLTTSAATSTSLLNNGGFETPVTSNGGYTTLQTGSAGLTPWAITAGAVDVVNNAYTLAYQGSNSIDMAGPALATISQTFATVAGATYALTFAYSNNPDFPSGSAEVNVAGASTVLSTTVAHAGASRTNMNYQVFSGLFVANSSSTTLQFRDTSNQTNGGLELDAVSVTTATPAAGEAFTVTVTALDASNNTVTNYSGAIHFTSSDPQAVLPANSTLLNGVGTFSVTLKTAGNQTVTATDAAVTSLAATTNSIGIRPAAASRFAVNAPSNTTAGTGFTVTVTALDAYNNTATNYAGTVHLTSSDSQALLPANANLTAGVGSFIVVLTTAGNQTVIATDTAANAINGISAAINVNPIATTTSVSATPNPSGVGETVTFTALTVPTGSVGGNSGLTASYYNLNVTPSGVNSAFSLPSGLPTANAILVNTRIDAQIKVPSDGNNATGFVPPSPVPGLHTTNVAVAWTGKVQINAGGSYTFFSPSDDGSFLYIDGVQVVTNDGSHPFGDGTSTPITLSVGMHSILELFIQIAGAAGVEVDYQGPDTNNSRQIVPASAFFHGLSGSVQFVVDGANYGSPVAMSAGTASIADPNLSLGNHAITAVYSGGGSYLTSNNNANPYAQAVLQPHFSINAPSFANLGGVVSFTVTALSPSNNTATGYSGIVHFTSSDGLAVLSANATLTSGVGTFSATLKTLGNQTVTATDTVTTSIATTSNPILVANAATHFAVSAPANATIGSAFNLTVTALDQFNNPAVGYNGTIAFSSTDNGTTLPPYAAGSFVLVNDGTRPGHINEYTPSGVQVQTFSIPESGDGSPRGITVDKNGNAAIYNGDFSPSLSTVSLTNGAALSTIPFSGGGSYSMPFVGGVAAFGNYVFVSSMTTGGMIRFNVNDHSAVRFATDKGYVSVSTGLDGLIYACAGFTGIDSEFYVYNPTTLAFVRRIDLHAGLSWAAVDRDGTFYTGGVNSNAIYVFSPSGALLQTIPTPLSQIGDIALDGSGRILASSNTTVLVTDKSFSNFTTFTPANSGGGFIAWNMLPLGIPLNLTNGVGTFTATLKTNGLQTITVTDAANSTSTGTSNVIATSNPATHFVATVQASATAGTAFNVTIKALDQANNTAIGYAGTVHFASSDGQAILPANAALTNGVGTFSVTLKTSGSQTLVVTDAVAANITAAISNVTVSATAATHLGVSIPAIATVGSASPITVTALDQFNNTATSYSGTVAFTSSDPAAVLPANATLTTGTRTFSVTLNTAGSQTVTATDVANTTITGTSAATTVRNPATHFGVSAAASVVAGSALSFTVTALDANNIATLAYNGTVHFTSSDSQAVLPANATLANGVGTFTVTLKTAGGQTLTATDTATSSIAGTSNTITVSAAAATHLGVSTPATATAGSAFVVTVTALDQFNNTATGYTGTVHLTSNDSQAALAADKTLSSGVGTFSVTLKTAGGRTVTATDTVTSSNKGTSSTISVNAAAAARFAVSGAPSTITAGTAFNVTLTALDAFSNTVTGYAGAVHFSSSDAQATLSPDKTLSSGVGAFSVTLKTAGSQTVTATDAANSSIGGIVTTSVSVAAPARFNVAAPLVATTGSPFTVTVTATDSFGNAVTNYVGTLHFSKTDTGAGAAVPADYTFVTADHGSHTFINGVTLVTTGTQTITARDTVASSIAGNVVVNVPVTLSIPTTLLGGRNNIVTVPVNISGLTDDANNNSGLSGGDIVLFYDPAFFTLADADVHTGSLTSAAAGWSVLANTATPGQIVIGLSNGGGVPNTSTTGGSLVTIDFHVKGSAPIGATSAIDLAADLLGGLPLTHVSDQNGRDYTFAPAPADGADPNDGLITIVNQAPVASGDLFSITERDDAADPSLIVAAPGVLANDVELDGDAMAAVKVSNPAHGSVTLSSDGSFVYTPNLGYRGPDSFTYKASDGLLNSSVVTVNLSVTSRLSIPSNLSGIPGGSVVVPVNIDNPSPVGSGGLTAATLAINFDPSVFSVDNSDVQLGTLTGGWTLTADVNSTSGQIGIDLSSSTPLTGTTAGSLALITFHIKANTPGAATTINLAATNSPNGTVFTTHLNTANGALPLRPAPSNAATDAGVDGVVTVIGASHFAIVGASSATAGSASSFTVTALDQFNHTDTNYTGAVHFTSSDGQAIVPTDVTLASGVETFSVTFKTVASQTLTGTDTVNGITGTSNSVTVIAAAADHFSVSAPATVTYGSAFNFTVTAFDAFGNTAAAYSGAVHFISSDGQAVLPADATLASGAGTFSATLKTAGIQTLTATDSVSSSVKGTSNAISPAATQFTFGVPSSTTAGSNFLFTVTAKDQFGGTTAGYTGIVHIRSSDPQAMLSGDATLSSGVGFFAAILRTAGSQTLTATDTANSNLSSTSSGIAVSATLMNHLGVTTPANVATGIPFSFTVKALDPYNNIIPGYAGIVHFSSSDGAAGLPGDAILTSGVGSFNATLQTVGNQIVSATDTVASSIGGSSSLITVRGLMVQSVTPTATGFAVQFNKPFDPASLNLYDSFNAFGAADVTLVGPSGAIRGSLLTNATGTGFTFIKTGVGTTGIFAGILAAGTYTVTIRSAADGFKDVGGGRLDGNGDGVSGDNYVATFTVASSSSPVLSIPDFARGPDSANSIKVPNNTGTGIPITLSNAVNVTDATFTLNYNPALLTVTGALNGPSGTFSLQGTPSGGVASFSFHSASALSGKLTLGQIVAQVPNSAANSYKGRELLHLSSILLNGNNTSTLNDDGLHVNAYFGDASGDGSFSPLDATLIARTAINLDTGFAAHRLVDPSIIGDVNNNGFADSTDVTLLNRSLAGIPATQIPSVPNGMSVTPTGLDPALSLPTDLRAAPGEAVLVPVMIDTARPEGSGGMLEAILALRFDPQVFTVSAADIRLGSLPLTGLGWQLRTEVNASTGEIGIDIFSSSPITATASGSLVTLTMHVRENAPAGASAINLVHGVNPTGQRTYVTMASDAVDPFVLHPAVTDGSDAEVDGQVTVPAATVLRAEAPDSTSRLWLGSTESSVAFLSGGSLVEALQPLANRLVSGNEDSPTPFEEVFNALPSAALFRENGMRPLGVELEFVRRDAMPTSVRDLAFLLQACDASQAVDHSDDCLSVIGRALHRKGKAAGTNLYNDCILDGGSGDAAAIDKLFASE